MKYGLIGEHLKHSFSKEIHAEFAGYEYELCEIERERLDLFMTERDFRAVNVTIPYKELVIPHLYEIDSAAKEIGAVNTVVNRDGRLSGYNTDFYGMKELFRHAGIDPKGKKAAVLGTGGTSKTARAVLKSLGACEILTVSRSEQAGCVTYSELRAHHLDTEIIVNTTPVGMFPNTDTSPLSLSGFKSLAGVIDAVYNPLRTKLVSEALSLGVPAEGGLYMLVAQAKRASEIFTDVLYPQEALADVYRKILASKENIVLTGMPSSGKSTVGSLLAEMMKRKFLDTDAMIVEKAGIPITEIFQKFGERHFRLLEAEAIAEASSSCGVIIATGGGAVLDPANIEKLKQNGKIVFLDRALEDLTPTQDRPLALDVEAIKRRYSERYPIYNKTADFTFRVTGTALELAETIKEKFEQ